MTKTLSLRYDADPDKIMVGGVYVRADGLSESDVVVGLKRFWGRAGATEAGTERVESGAFKRESLVGFVVVPPAPDVDGASWIGLRDSVHYSLRDWTTLLAEALNAYLNVPTFGFDVGPKTRLVSIGMCHYYGVARKSSKSRDKSVAEADRFPHPFFTYETAAAIEGAQWIAFRHSPEVSRNLEFNKKFWKG